MSKLARFALIGLLALLSAIVVAETPDECAARLDQSIAIRTYDEAAEWWAQVERECAPEPETASTPEATEIPGYQGIYGWEGDFVFCVMAPTLNIRNTPAGTVVNRFNKGDHFTIDLATQTLVEGYVWAKHSKGWSALFRYPGVSTIVDLAHPQVCPKPTPRPTPTRARTTARTASTCQDKNLIRTARSNFVGSVRRAEAICSTKHIMVDFKLGDNLFFGPVTVAEHAMYDLLCKLRINDYGITFDIAADFIDAAGNESESRAILARFEAGAVRRLNCNSAAGMIQWNALASTWWVHPSVN